MKWCATVFCVCVLFAAAAGQEPSLGDVVREAKAKPKPKAKVVVDTDNIRGSKLPIPDVSLVDDNSDQIVDAILKYRDAHTPKETEDMVRNWYDRQDGVVESAAAENRKIVDRQRSSYHEEDMQDYEKFQKAERERQMQRRQDARRWQEYSNIVQRTTATLISVKMKLQASRMAYSWMNPHYRDSSDTGSPDSED